MIPWLEGLDRVITITYIYLIYGRNQDNYIKRIIKEIREVDQGKGNKGRYLNKKISQ